NTAVQGDEAVTRVTVASPPRIADVALSQLAPGEPLFAGRALRVAVTYQPPRPASGALTLEGSAIPPSGQSAAGQLTFVIPQERVHDGMTFTVEVFDGDGPRDTRVIPALSLRGAPRLPGSCRIVAYRPVVVTAEGQLQVAEADFFAKCDEVG